MVMLAKLFCLISKKLQTEQLRLQQSCIPLHAHANVPRDADVFQRTSDPNHQLSRYWEVKA